MSNRLTTAKEIVATLTAGVEKVTAALNAHNEVEARKAALLDSGRVSITESGSNSKEFDALVKSCADCNAAHETAHDELRREIMAAKTFIQELFDPIREARLEAARAAACVFTLGNTTQAQRHALECVTVWPLRELQAVLTNVRENGFYASQLSVLHLSQWIAAQEAVAK